MILNSYDPYWKSAPTIEIDKITVISQIIDKRFASSTDDSEKPIYPSMCGGHAIFFNEHEAMDYIVNFQSTLSKMMATPVDFEFYSDVINDLIHAHFILQEEPKEEEAETPEEPVDPEQPAEETEEPETTEKEI